MVHQSGVFDGAHAVADATDAQIAQRVAHRFRPAPFTRMRRQPQPRFARGVKGIGEIVRGQDSFVPGNAKARDERARRFLRAGRDAAR